MISQTNFRSKFNTIKKEVYASYTKAQISEAKDKFEKFYTLAFPEFAIQLNMYRLKTLRKKIRNIWYYFDFTTWLSNYFNHSLDINDINKVEKMNGIEVEGTTINAPGFSNFIEIEFENLQDQIEPLVLEDLDEEKGYVNVWETYKDLYEHSMLNLDEICYIQNLSYRFIFEVNAVRDDWSLM